ncbi:hypothetical protein E4L40_02345 [Pseudomonas putida]|nr:hypothetical protein E4L40_02345 [Pseudomonas putida]
MRKRPAGFNESAIGAAGPALSRVNPLLHRPPQPSNFVVACVGAGLPAKGPANPAQGSNPSTMITSAFATPWRWLHASWYSAER